MISKSTPRCEAGRSTKIESKEQIREVLENAVGDKASTEIIQQLEHWWDKYKVSLHELDAQVSEAEETMKGFLQELGYE